MKKAERLRAGLHMLGGTSVNKHTVFLDSKKKAQKFDPAEHFDTAPELADRAFNRPRVATLEAEPITGAVNKKELKKALKKRDVAYRVSRIPLLSLKQCVRRSASIQ
jgi:U3 small nucleolar RNA-associated protein 11